MLLEEFMPHMYILECCDGSYYTGSTTNLELRLRQHQEGMGAQHTAKRLPVELVYCEFFDRVSDAFDREKQIQGWSRKKKEALIYGDRQHLPQLAACQNLSHHCYNPARFDFARFDSAQRPSGDDVIDSARFDSAQRADNSNNPNPDPAG
jgi:putative endonuclease